MGGGVGGTFSTQQLPINHLLRAQQLIYILKRPDNLPLLQSSLNRTKHSEHYDWRLNKHIYSQD